MDGILKKISYERRLYESVDEKNISWAMSRKTKKKEYIYINNIRNEIIPLQQLYTHTNI